MKKLLLFCVLTTLMSHSYAQWTTITIPNTTTGITALNAAVDTVYAGFAGDGIFKTSNLGNDWSDISFNLANKNINNLQMGPYPFIFVSTDNGPYFTIDQQSYIPAMTTGLTNTDVSHYWIGGNQDDNDFTVGTNGGGFFYGPEIDGPWTAANNGLSGDALMINSMAGYSDVEDYFILGTDGGVFYSNNEFASWTAGNNGLSGAQLHVTGVLLLSNFSIITTEDGAFFSMDYGASWSTLFADIRFNQLLLTIGNEGNIGLFFLGEQNYFTADLENWINFPAPSEVVYAAATTNQLFVATSETKAQGTLYSQPINWIITGNDELSAASKNLNSIRNYPNPFTDESTVSYTVASRQAVEISLFDMYGRKIQTLENRVQEAGEHRLKINGTDLAPGIYTTVIIAGNQKETLKIVRK